MPLSSLRQVLTRLWYVTALGLMMTVGLVVGAAHLVPAKYETQARILLLQKALPGDATGANPFLGISGLTPFTDVIARSMSDTAAFEELKAAGVTSTYVVVRDLTTNGPVLLVTVTGASADAAIADLEAVVTTAGPILARLQADAEVAADAQISAQIITQDTSATTVRKSQIRAVVVGAAAGAFLTVLAAIAIDRAFGRRRGVRSTVDGADDGPGDLQPGARSVESPRRRRTDLDAPAVEASPSAPASPPRRRRSDEDDEPAARRTGELAGWRVSGHQVD